MKKLKKVTILCLIAAISVLIAIGCTNDNSAADTPATAATTEDAQTPEAATPAGTTTTPTTPADNPSSGSDDDEDEPEVDACADVDCNAGQTCVNGTCRVIRHSNGEACSCDDNCQSGYCDASTRTCTNRPCSDEGCACSVSHDCAEGLICQDGLCTRPTYTITYNLNNGSWKSGYTAQTSYEANSEVTLPDSSEVRRDYYRFLGWFENESDTEPVTSISNIDGNKSYIAKWEAYTNRAGPGEYMTEEGQIRACPAGTYNSLTGRTSCIPCPAGTYSSSSGATSCTACANGYISGAGARECDACVPEQHSNSSHTACES